VLAVERRLKLLERVAADQAIEVSSLARDFSVSEMTIRRDLSRLERDGFVRRTYGGATTHVVRAFEVGFNARVLQHASEKHHIARRAAELTAGARVMFIGIGSTVEQFARLLVPRPELVVVTPSLAVASLLGTRKVRVIVTGGMVKQDELTCIGAAAVEAVQRYNTDTAVIGAGGVSARAGVTEFDDREADVIRAAADRTQRLVVLADGSKFGDVAMSTVVPAERIHTVVTDSTAPAAEVESIERAGVRVIAVDPRAEARRHVDGESQPARRTRAPAEARA
jgi:DeoR/GlpR family transcriptional regulator of sugar metabolism